MEYSLLSYLQTILHENNENIYYDDCSRRPSTLVVG
jgi:hypothetical protein